jgi:hypothetical protein
MRLHIFRDKDRSGHLDFVGDGDHPWTIDMVVTMTAAVLIVGFAIALASLLIR